MESEHSACGVVAKLWITSCLHCTQVSDLNGYVICVHEFHFEQENVEIWRGGLYCCCRRMELVYD